MNINFYVHIIFSLNSTLNAYAVIEPISRITSPIIWKSC